MGLKLSNGWLWTRGGALPFARRFARCCRRFAGLVGLPAARPPARTGLPILLTLAAAIAATGLAQESRQYPFSGGETLRYAVKWKSLPAGNAVLSVHQDKVMTGRWNIAATATSVGYVSNIYKVADEYHSTFRNPAFCSLGIHKTIHEGGRDREVKLEFDARRKQANLEERDLSNQKPPRVERFTVPDCVQDILSAVYYARTIPLKVGQSFGFPLNDGGKTIQIRVEVQAEEEVATPGGKFRAFRLEPDLFDGHLFSGKGRIFIWISNDARRLPLQLRAQTDAGTIIAQLTAAEHDDAAH